MIVAEAYLRIAPTLLDAQKRQLGAAALEIAERAAREFFGEVGPSPIAEVVIEDGSTKWWVRVRKSAIILTTAVGGYGTVRTGIDYIRRDGRTAAAWISEHMVHVLPVQPDVRRNRSPAATRFRRLFDSVEKGEMSADDASKRAEEILKNYQETSETIRAVLPQMTQEFRALQPDLLTRKPRRRRTDIPQVRADIYRGRRMSIFRDQRTGRIVFSERE